MDFMPHIVPYNEVMSEFAHELPIRDTQLVHALGRKSKFAALVIAMFGLNAGEAHEQNQSHFPTTLGLEKRSPGRLNPIKAPIVAEPNDNCVINELNDPNELLLT